jgi:hypothetical protein
VELELTFFLQESAAAWSADDDAHEDKSEIDDQLNCVRFALCCHLFCRYHHSKIVTVTRGADLRTCAL